MALYLSLWILLQCCYAQATPGLVLPEERTTGLGCIPEGKSVSYRCFVDDPTNPPIGSTVWGGSAFSCPSTSNRIVLPHIRFGGQETSSCGNLIAMALKVNGTIYESQLNVTASNMQNGTISCSLGDLIQVGSDLLSYGANPPPPDLLWVVLSSGSSLNVSWSPPSGPVEGGAGGYVFDVTGEGCGCVSMNVSGDTTSVTCSGWTAAGQTCSFEVRTLSKDCGFSSSSPVKQEVAFCDPTELGDSATPSNGPGELRISNGVISYNGVITNSIATLICDPGYTPPLGSRNRTCETNGSWSHSVDVQTCVPISAPRNLGYISILLITILPFVLFLVGLFVGCSRSSQIKSKFVKAILIVITFGGLAVGLKISEHRTSEGGERVKMKRCGSNDTGDDYNNQLLDACRIGRLHVIKNLVKKLNGDITNVRNKNGDTPLHRACSCGHKEVVKYLVESVNCDINVRDNTGASPLYLACHEGHTKLVNYLIQTAKCDINLKNEDNNSPLHQACIKGYRDIVKLLTKKAECDINAENNYSSTPLHRACNGGHIGVVKYLVEETKCDINAKDNEGATPLYDACIEGRIDVVKYLVEKAKCHINIRDKDNTSPLHYACRGGHKDVVKYLVEEAKCDTDVRNKNNDAPLHSACSQGRIDAVKYLVESANCDVNMRGNGGASPLYAACQEGHMTVVKYLIETAKCDTSLKNQNEATPLHIACSRGHTDVVKYLVESVDCDVNIRDNDNTSPLHYACRGGHINIVKYLVEEARCHTDIETKNKETPLDIAHSEGHEEVEEYLVKNAS